MMTLRRLTAFLSLLGLSCSIASCVPGVAGVDLDEGDDGEAILNQPSTSFDFADGVAELAFIPDTQGFLSTTIDFSGSLRVFSLRWLEADNPGAQTTAIPMYVRFTNKAGVRQSAVLESATSIDGGYGYTYALSGPAGRYAMLISSDENVLRDGKKPIQPPITSAVFQLRGIESTAAHQSEIHFAATSTTGKPAVTPTAAKSCKPAPGPPGCETKTDPGGCGVVLGCSWVGFCARRSDCYHVDCSTEVVEACGVHTMCCVKAEACSGTAEPCENLASEVACGRQVGCGWK